MESLARQGEQCFLLMVRQMKPIKSQGLTEAHKREKMKQTGPIKLRDIKEVKKEVLEGVGSQFREGLTRILDEYESVFPAQLPSGPPPSRGVEHGIDLVEGAEPVDRPPYRLQLKEQDELEAQLKDLLAQGFIRPSHSPYGAPVLFVPKKDGRWRMCIDYRALNKTTIKDKHALPRIDDLLDRLGKAKFFTKLDLASGYHQIAMKEKDIMKTAFRTSRGHYEFTVMPFGLTNAPATFQRLMNTVFADEWGNFVIVYLDDILIFSETAEQHLDHIRAALKRLQQASLFGRLHKSTFCQEEVEYLGFHVSSFGIRPSPDKVAAVVDWPRPQTVRDVRSFLGLSSYYRRFIRHYSLLARPLTELTKTDTMKQWGVAEQKSFDQLKAALVTAPVLRLPDFSRQFVLTTDASLVAVGAVLKQYFGDGLQPVAYESRKLNSTQMRYSAYERELLGIVEALRKWRSYLQGQRFIIQTDHSSLRHLPNQPSVNRRIWKWIGILQSYDFEIRHIPGVRNPADSPTCRDWVGQRYSVKKNAKVDSDLVKILRVGKDATHEEISSALQQLFSAEHSVLSEPEKCTVSVAVTESESQRAVLSVSRSTIRLQTELKLRILRRLREEEPYKTILDRFEGENIPVLERDDGKYKIQHSLLLFTLCRQCQGMSTGKL